MSKFKYDIAVIGGGPGGYLAASYAVQFGKKVTIIEKEKLGGCCLNVGCIPTKILVDAANRFEHAKGSQNFGVISHKVTFDWRKLSDYSIKIRADLADGVETLMRKRKVDIIQGEAEFRDQHSISVGGEVYTAENIILATGAKPSAIPKSFKSDRVLTSDDFWNLDHKPERLVIVGGGVIGCEIASAMSRLGTEVYIVEQFPRILMTFSEKAAGLVTKKMEKDGVRFYCGQGVKDINETTNGLSIIVGSEKIICNYVLWATGRKPIELKSEMKIAYTDYGFVKVDKNYQTSIENVYCIGDANGLSMLAHSAMSQGMRVVEHICSGLDVEEDPHVPQCVFTYPAIARVGFSEAECREKGLNVVVGKAPYLVAGYSRAIDETNGYFEVIRDIKTDAIVGAEIVGHNAYELIHILAPYVNKRIPVKAMSDLIIAHPTLSEGIKIAVESTYTGSPQI